MKNKILQLVFLLMCGNILVTLPCCTKDGNEESNSNSGGSNSGNNSGENNESQSVHPWDNYQPSSYDIQLENKLLNTSWHWSKQIFYNASSGNTSVTTPSNTYGDFRYSELSYKDKHSICIDGQKKGLWWIENGNFCQSFTPCNDEDFEYIPYHSGQLRAQFGFYYGTHGSNDASITILTLTESEFIWRVSYDDGDYFTNYYTRSSGNGGGGNSSYELPDVGFFDYEPALYSLIVKFKIYNNSEAQVSRAKVYYGTSTNPTSSVNATISGTIITAHITGLSSGTKYYVKCQATGPGGTTTTSVVPCMTQYP